MLAERIGCAEGELNERGYHVESAGAHAAAGLPASDAAVRILKQRGVDISGHRSQSLALEQIHRADHIFVMTEGHLESVRAMVSDARDKSRTVDDSDIEDPVGGSDAVYARSADRIAEALGRRLKEIEL
jgi:protein-tyrosine-phosphatase